MRVVSVNVSAGTLIEWQGRCVLTGIFKRPVIGRVRVRRDGLAGDRQADLTVHGGELKAVYSYSLANYEWWNLELGRELPPGMFGENLTIDGLDEETVAIGDRFTIGTTILEAVQPRLPCYKLGVRFGDPKMVKRFMQSGRFGTYFRVVREGDVGVGDDVHLVHYDPEAALVVSLVRQGAES
jgi:MOSC domain-containing protein YiiM